MATNRFFSVLSKFTLAALIMALILAKEAIFKKEKNIFGKITVFKISRSDSFG